ncbi:MAG: SPASM domain-containing protein, partial [Anaerolineales bacterium]|nr:SPASM domain-containing protein [Anaerolineales bacterium]
CVAAREIVEIEPDGQTAACSFSTITAGRAEDLAQNWFSPPFQQIRRWETRAPEPCRSCRYLDLCRGGCRALAATLTGDPDAPDPECPFIDGG